MHRHAAELRIHDRELSTELNVNRETIQPLLMGRDLIALGVPPGPGMGRLLKELYRMQLDNVYETREAGLEAARRLLEEKQA